MKKFLIISAVLFGVVSTENCFCMDDEDVNIRKSVVSVKKKVGVELTTVLRMKGDSRDRSNGKLVDKLLEFSKEINVLEKKNKSLEEAKIQQENELMASIESLNFEKSLLSKENSELKDKLAFVEQGMMELLAKIKQ